MGPNEVDTAIATFAESWTGTAILATGSQGLRPEVEVDVYALMAVGVHGRGAADRTATSATAELGGISWPELALDILPDWYDDWLLDGR